MRWRPFFWLLMSFWGLTLTWRMGGEPILNPGRTQPSAPLAGAAASVVTRLGPGLKNVAGGAGESDAALGLSNTDEPVSVLARRSHALLLENARLDTWRPLDLPIPEPLKAREDPGAYIVQSKTPVGAEYRSVLQGAGAKIVSYVPNNAYLVRASASVARALAAEPGTQAVLAYQPYYKLMPPLLRQAAASASIGPDANSSFTLDLNVLLFESDRAAASSSVRQLGFDLVDEESSPFGTVFHVRGPVTGLCSLANLECVQAVDERRRRVRANDLSRVALGITPDPQTSSNYLGLTGTNVLVAVSDTGVDATHPDLSGRVSFLVPASGSDSNGHGTHVAGVIASSGSQSDSVTNAPGSTLPTEPFQFRGMAPAARIISLSADLETGPGSGDSALQQAAARSHALISNNSWNYSNADQYDFAAASYDAAVRDALPTEPGAQPLIFVFSAGNSGKGMEDGSGGMPDTVMSPATAKNVITVGAIEAFRLVTNQTWTCSTNGGPTTCLTNTPWLLLTDSSNQVAAFSSRGNVGVGVEGEFGRFKPDLVAPGTFVISTRSGQWDEGAYFDQPQHALVESPDTNWAVTLSNLNYGLGQPYRFESGTSLAAAGVSGTLALMSEFFAHNFNRTNSPALMKALLINGARSLGWPYDFSQKGITNFQGWGLARLATSLPVGLANEGSASAPLFFVDQTASSALATGQSRTRHVSVAPPARNHPLRFTLTWTDPPGNPVAGLKLVNDLDLLVTNLDTGEVFWGNDIPAGLQFNPPRNAGVARDFDCVNNVENVFVAAPVAGNYSVSVVARRVGVNAVSERVDDILQDYALVVSSGDGEVTNALTMQADPTISGLSPLVTAVTNGFDLAPTISGGLLTGQRVGANLPFPATNTIPLPIGTNDVLAIGIANQWRFYLLTNGLGATNAAFLTFATHSLSIPAGTNQWSGQGSSEPDIDLYVSSDPGLTNLEPAVLAAAAMSCGRGGTETVILTNVLPGSYYAAVKCESALGAEYNFLGVFSEEPFSQDDGQGNLVVSAIPAAVPIPPGSAELPGTAFQVGLISDAFPVRRVIATNTFTHSSPEDLSIDLVHGSAKVKVLNHSVAGAVVHQALTFDDSREGDFPQARTTDGPGALTDFGGMDGLGQWQVTLMDTNRAGTNDSFGMFLERQPDLTTGINPTLLPGAFRRDFILVPPEATNLTVSAILTLGQGPVLFQVTPMSLQPSNTVTLSLTPDSSTAGLTYDASSQPPLNSGLYCVVMSNQGSDAAVVNGLATLGLGASLPSPVRYTKQQVTVIPDDAVTSSSILVTNIAQVASVEVGVRVDHPRISDLTMRLVSPDGTRVLLSQNRGGDSTSGLGLNLLSTNVLPVSSSGGPEAATNTINTGQTAGTIRVDYDFLSLPDEMHIYYQGNLIYDSGLVSGTGATNVAYGPGSSTMLTILMNEGGNFDTNTAWSYTVTATHVDPMFVTFTEDSNLAATPIKFVAPPFTNLNYFGAGLRTERGIFYLPEESLARITDHPAYGPWRLEVSDDRAGATNPTPILLSWQLSFQFRQTLPLPVLLSSGQNVTNTICRDRIQWFVVNPPAWVSFMTNSLVSASAPLSLLFNQNTPPTGTNVGDFLLLLNSTNGTATLRTNATPVLVPGSVCYLGVQNTNAQSVTFAFSVSFDVSGVTTLESGVVWQALNPGPAGTSDYYRYLVSSNASRAQFEINSPTGDMTLAVRQGLPLPSLAGHDYISVNPGTNDELVVVYPYSTPIGLAPGEWFLTAINSGGGSAAYSIIATEFPVTGTNIVLVGNLSDTNAICLTWNSLPLAHYYIQGKVSLADLQWTDVSGPITADDISTTWCMPLPSPFHFFRVSEGLVVVPSPLVISSITSSTNGVLLRWTASPNSLFKVDWARSLVPGSWIPFTNTISSADSSYSFLDNSSQSGRWWGACYYRLRRVSGGP